MQISALAQARFTAPARAGAVVASLVYVATLLLGLVPLGVDAHAYWASDPLHPYSTRSMLAQDGYFYSPAFTQALGPLHALPWPVFAAIWTLFLCAVLFWLGDRWFGYLLIVPVVAIEIAMGNIHILLAAAIALGFRFPALWAFVLLTKVTPGVGLLWFVVRREWRSLAIALAATALIALASFALRPMAWQEWINTMLGTYAAAVPSPLAIGIIPITIRLLAAAALVMWAGYTDRAWLVPVAAFIAVPVAYINSLAILVAVPYLWVHPPKARARGIHVAGLSTRTAR